MTQFVLYAYPLWALIAFIASLAYFVDYFFVTVERDSKPLLWGIVFLGWAIAFFGAGLLIAGAVNRAIATTYIEAIWVIDLPFFAFVVGVKCWRLWHTLRKIGGGKK